MSRTDSAPDLDQTLRERFALERFRPGQREVIEHVLGGRDVLCVMPTGGGKSLCYQLPALLLPGLTLVVSPLIALMKDQVDGLVERGVRATLLNSTLDPAEQRLRIEEIEAGLYDLVYVAPERFRSGRFVEAMGKVRPQLLAIDEAHCISEWGHDFRPDYARIGLARKKLGSPPCIALTATATDLVRRDIADQLDLQDPALFVTGFDRPNLTYSVEEARREVDKLQAVARVLAANPGAAIIYASSRARCESVADHLRRELRREAVVYHAGLAREERSESQERFMSGEAEVVVATNAFGMGVDKPDIRAVIHYNLPGTVEAYYQEAGRAGRDGLPSSCVLLYSPGDRILQERFIENEYPPADVVSQIYNYLRKLSDDPIERTQAEIRAETGIDLGDSAVGTALKLLEGAGAIERFLPRENMAIVRINSDAPDPDARPASLADRLGPQAHVQRIVLLGIEGLVNGRYAEPVYFHPDAFAGSLGLDRPALNRALKALTQELPIDYVPPFRGNALRVLDRDRKPRDLGVDFAALHERKQREYDKLERMVQYAQTHACRRAYILGYFGDPSADQVHCGHCDNCGSGEGAASRASAVIDTPAAREVVLKVLSGVARAKGRFGKTMVAQMLKGSGSEKMDRLGLRKLTTFGILPDFALPELTLLLDALAGAGLLELPEVERFRPVVHLAQPGWDYLKDPTSQDLRLSLPLELLDKVRNGGLARLNHRAATTATSAPANAPTTPLAEGTPLHTTLKELRLRWAREEGKRAYNIFTDATLETLIQVRPRSPHELASVRGVGPVTLERYGAAILEAIRASGPATPPAAPTSTPPLAVGGSHFEPPARESSDGNAHRVGSGSSGAAYVTTEEWTWRLLDRGFTPDEAAAIRGLDRAAIDRHAFLAARRGRKIDVDPFVPPGLLEIWETWRSEGETGPPPGSEHLTDLWSLYRDGFLADDPEGR